MSAGAMRRRIRGGTLYDGSGAPGRPGDVAIRGGRIAALGEVRGSAELDATGCLAADVMVFDPERVGCSPLRRVRDLPGGADRVVSDAFGIRTVVVEGTLLREHGRDALDPDTPLPGRVLRGGRGRN